MTAFIQDPYGTRSYTKLSSVIVPVATTITLGDEGYLDASMFDNTISAEFFSDADGTSTTASVGTVTVTVASVVNSGVFEAVTDNVITAATPTTVTWGMNTAKIKAVPASIAGATHWRVNVTLNSRGN